MEESLVEHCTIKKAAIPAPVLTDRFEGSGHSVHSQPEAPLEGFIPFTFLDLSSIIVETTRNYKGLLFPGECYFVFVYVWKNSRLRSMIKSLSWSSVAT